MAQSVTINQPLILAIETSGLCGSVALVRGNNCIAELSITSSATHSKRILTSIEQILTLADIDVKDIDAFAVSLGPGSFTGLRIGLSTAKGFSLATEKPLLGIPTLDALARQASPTQRLICPVLDARKHEIYSALYRTDDSGTTHRISDYQAIPPAEFARKLNEPVLLLGDGASLYRNLFQETLGENACFLSHEIFFPKASAVGSIALEMYRLKEFIDPVSVVPIYIRKSDAELNFLRK